jgi:hypothetical protein
MCADGDRSGHAGRQNSAAFHLSAAHHHRTKERGVRVGDMQGMPVALESEMKCPRAQPQERVPNVVDREPPAENGASIQLSASV